MHVGRIKYHTIYLTVFIWQMTTVNSILYVRCKQDILIGGYAAPEYTLAVGDICNSTPWRNVQTQNPGEKTVIPIRICAENEIVCRNALMHLSLPRILDALVFACGQEWHL